MKFVFTAKEINLINKLVPAYVSDPEAIENLTDTSYRFMPALTRKLDEVTGELVYEIPENFVIDVTNACHQALHPYIGDIKAVCRLIMTAANGILTSLKETFGKVNKTYEIKYAYKVYTADDPEVKTDKIVWIMAHPTNANFRDHVVEARHRTGLTWDVAKEPERFMADAREFGTYESRDEAFKVMENLVGQTSQREQSD